jgi:threonine dehydrogenase-like Zn-dependent dehydrogenase
MAISPRGKIIQVGTHPDRRSIDFVPIVNNEITISGVRVYTDNDFRKSVDLIKNPDFNVKFIATHTFPLENTKLAFDTVHTSASVGKVLIRI